MLDYVYFALWVIIFIVLYRFRESIKHFFFSPVASVFWLIESIKNFIFLLVPSIFWLISSLLIGFVLMLILAFLHYQQTGVFKLDILAGVLATSISIVFALVNDYFFKMTEQLNWSARIEIFIFLSIPFILLLLYIIMLFGINDVGLSKELAMAQWILLFLTILYSIAMHSYINNPANLNKSIKKNDSNANNNIDDKELDLLLACLKKYCHLFKSSN